MPSNVQTRRIWRNAVVFDGLRTLEGLHAVVVEGEKIAGVLPMGEVDDSRYNHHQDMGSGGVITPGLVDCHTHLVFGGNRAEEFEARLEGVSYEEISRRCGGRVLRKNCLLCGPMRKGVRSGEGPWFTH